MLKPRSCNSFGMKTFILTLALLVPSLISAQDKAGCKDHPVITRYPGSVIGYCEEQNHMEYAIAQGKISGYRQIDTWTEVRGKRTRIYYTLKGDMSIRDVYLNYQSALKRAGATMLADGIEDKSTSPNVGSRTYLGIHYGRNEFPPSAGIVLLNGSATSGGSFMLAGTLNDQGTTVHVVVGGTQYTTETKLVLVDIIEEVGIDTDQIQVNAEWMKQQIDRFGKVALSDILFDTDKATVQPGSMAIIGEIGKLLNAHPPLKVYIVGHTDMTGAFEHNMDLSRQRANEVVRILATDHGIDKGRLGGHGVGPLVPVSTNTTAEGRQLNRRVEVVAR